MHRTLKKLAKDNSIKVCKFDKGVGVCIMNSDDYYTKLDTIVSDDTKFEITKELALQQGRIQKLMSEKSSTRMYSFQ